MPPKPTTQPRALNRNRTSDPLFCGTMPIQLNHTGQGWVFLIRLNTGSERCWKRQKILPLFGYHLPICSLDTQLSWSQTSSLVWTKSLHLKLLWEELPKCPNSVHCVSKIPLCSGQQLWLQDQIAQRKSQKNSVSGRIFYTLSQSLDSTLAMNLKSLLLWKCQLT